jgi:PAS domain S-box-containing protein
MADTDQDRADIIAEQVQKIEELKKERDLIQSILKTSNNLIFCMDKDARITVFNDKLESFTGYKREEVIGKRWPDIFLPENFHAFKFINFGEWVRQHPADTYEGPLKIKSGEIKTILWTNSAIISPDSDEITAIAIGQDVTVRKQAEESLKKSESRYGLATAAARVGVWEWDIRTGEFYLDANIKAILGYHDDEIPNDLEKWTDYVHPDDRAPVMEAAQAHLDGKTPEYVFEHRMLHKDGSIRWIFVRGKAIRDESGRIIRLVGTDTDITERKQIEDILRETERRFRELTELLPQTIFEIDTEGYITFANRFGLEFTGYSQEDIDNGLNIVQLFDPEYGEILKSNLQKRLRGESTEGNEYVLISKDGGRYPVISYSSPIIRDGEAVGLRGVLMDISRHKKIESELKKFKTISDKASYGAAIVDVNGRLIYINECYAKMHGYSPDEILSTHFSIFYNEEQMLDVNRLYEFLIANGSFSAEKVWHTRKDGTVFPTLMSATAIKDDDGKPIFLSATVIDITELDMVQKALTDSEQRFKKQYDSIPVPTYTWKKSGDDFIFAGCNDMAMEETDGKITLKLGTKFTDMYPGWNEGLEDIERCYREKKTIRRQTWYTYVSTGVKRFLDASIVFIPPDMIMVHAVDLSELKITEKSLRESEGRWRSLVENIPHLILMVDAEGKVIFVNRTITARRSEDVIGSKIYDYICPEFYKTIQDTISKVLQTGEPDFFETRGLDKYGGRYYMNQIGPVKQPGGDKAAIIIATDISDHKHAIAMAKSRLRLLNDLRQTRDIDACLNLGCRAIYEAGLFRRAVLTLHNEKREITNLGFVGLDKEIVRQARHAPAPDQELTRSLTKEEYRISKSYFVPNEAALPIEKTPRHISQMRNDVNTDAGWKTGDELFVPIVGDGKRYEGWLSVDTPFDGKRPTRESAEILEEIVEIVTQQVREIRILNKLNDGHIELQQKNVALREILSHIEEEKVAIKRQIAENIDKVLMPAIKKLEKPDGSISINHLNIITDALHELAETSGGLSRAYSTLAPREVEVCNLIRHGATSKQISHELFITLGTVKRHREMIRKKLGLKNKDINLATYLRNL